MTNFFVTIILAAFCISCTSKKPYTDVMKTELKSMYTKDMEAQKYDLKKVERKSYSDSMRFQFDKICKDNLIVVKKYFKEYGFPGIKENGNETALNFWLVVQHGDHDVAFQKKVMKAMKRELKTQNVSSRNFAYLYDRVKKNENKPQLYGTQMVWDNKGVHSPYNLEAPETVDQRRAEMGLEPLEDYVKTFNN